MTDESLAPFHRNRRRLPRKCMNLPVKPIDSWSRGIRRRLLVESNFESLHPHESSSKANRQLVKRNPPSSSGGTAQSTAGQEESAVVFWWNRTSNLFTQHFQSKWK
ncbi:unnamed protein product [Protopolystoma xenopodis]|uniref:Uncharacterized protein n=1 Tax=Protopolystoma xenopodis TaxID=117903 RepID=A0A3S5A6A5_9PLAT|nr:unnamed protein product [Protopolystoma xenopodis]